MEILSSLWQNAKSLMYIPNYDVLDELKPCPFCGHRPVVYFDNDYTCTVKCENCEIEFYEQPIQRWQTRKYQENPFNILSQFEHWFAYEVAIRNSEV